MQSLGHDVFDTRRVVFNGAASNQVASNLLRVPQ